MEKLVTWTSKDDEMVILAQKFLSDARDCIDYGEFDHKQDIQDCMDWLKQLRDQFK